MTRLQREIKSLANAGAASTAHCAGDRLQDELI